jgi:hypothetical protein
VLSLLPCLPGLGEVRGREVQSLLGKTGIEILACNYSQFIATLYTLACRRFAEK